MAVARQQSLDSALGEPLPTPGHAVVRVDELPLLKLVEGFNFLHARPVRTWQPAVHGVHVQRKRRLHCHRFIVAFRFFKKLQTSLQASGAREQVGGKYLYADQKKWANLKTATQKTGLL